MIDDDCSRTPTYIDCCSMYAGARLKYSKYVNAIIAFMWFISGISNMYKGHHRRQNNK